MRLPRPPTGAALRRLARRASAGDALIWAGAFASLIFTYGVFAPLLDDWRSDRRPMTTGCRITQVIDGDTLDLACSGLGGFRARLVGYDAPELFSPRCETERAAAQRARNTLQIWALHAPLTEVAFLGSDPYGRTLVDMRLGGQRVASAMVDTGNGRRYLGNARRGWC